jgi:hypothetical protein
MSETETLPDLVTVLREHIKAHVDKHERTDADWNYLIKPFEIEPTLIPGSNVLRDPNNFAPEKDFVWDIFSITAQTFTAGSVTTYMGSLNGRELVVFNPAGTYWFDSKQILCTGKNKSLVFQAANLTGSAYVSCAGISVHRDVLARYIMSGG